MALFTPTSPDTFEDRARYTAGGLTEVACLDCLAKVLVRKNSEQQTAIQWQGRAADSCPEIARREAEPRPHQSIFEGCPRLAASIEAAVARGDLAVGLGVD